MPAVSVSGGILLKEKVQFLRAAIERFAIMNGFIQFDELGRRGSPDILLPGEVSGFTQFLIGCFRCLTGLDKSIQIGRPRALLIHAP